MCLIDFVGTEIQPRIFAENRKEMFQSFLSGQWVQKFFSSSLWSHKIAFVCPKSLQVLFHFSTSFKRLTPVQGLASITHLPVKLSCGNSP